MFWKSVLGQNPDPFQKPFVQSKQMLILKLVVSVRLIDMASTEPNIFRNILQTAWTPDTRRCEHVLFFELEYWLCSNAGQKCTQVCPDNHCNSTASFHGEELPWRRYPFCTACAAMLKGPVGAWNGVCLDLKIGVPHYKIKGHDLFKHVLHYKINPAHVVGQHINVGNLAPKNMQQFQNVSN